MAQVLARVSDDLRAFALGCAAGTRHGTGVELDISRRATLNAAEHLREAIRDAEVDQYR